MPEPGVGMDRRRPPTGRFCPPTRDFLVTPLLLKKDFLGEIHVYVYERILYLSSNPISFQVSFPISLRWKLTQVEKDGCKREKRHPTT